MEVRLVRRSTLRHWRRCRLRDHFWRQLRLRSKRPSVALSVGTAVHEALEDYYVRPENERSEAMLKAAFTQFAPDFPPGTKVKLKDDPANVVRVMGEYHRWAQLADKGLRFLQPEVPLTVHIFLPDKRFIGMWIGKVDGLLQRLSDGSYWVRDFKTMSQFRVSHFPYDEQFTAYIWASRIVTGLPIKGVVIDAIRKKRGDPPNIQRFWEVRNDGEIASYHENLIKQLLELDRTKEVVFPNLTKECVWDCPYVHDLCPAWRKGLPLQDFINASYAVVDEFGDIGDYDIEAEEE